MKPKTRTSTLTKLVIFTCFTCLAWVGFEIYHALSKTVPPQVPADILAPLNPELNSEYIDSLKNRLQVAETSLPVSLSPTPTQKETSPSPTVTISPSPISNLSPTPTPETTE